jgi:hypothetical protein
MNNFTSSLPVIAKNEAILAAGGEEKRRKPKILKTSNQNKNKKV